MVATGTRSLKCSGDDMHKDCSHTPGPWEINEGDGMPIAKVSLLAITAPCIPDIGSLSRDEILANARLMAAAPDLLSALRELVRAWDGTTFSVNERMQTALNDADAAITKAEG